MKTMSASVKRCSLAAAAAVAVLTLPGCGSGGGSDGTGDATAGPDGTQPGRDGAADSASGQDAAGPDGAPPDSGAPDAAGPDAHVPPGACDPYPCPAGAECYEETGLVHAPTQADPVLRLTYSPAPGTYTRIRLEMDVYHGGWASDPQAVRHNLFWLAHNARNFDMFGYANFEKPNTVHLVHGYGMVHGDKPKIRVNAQLPEFETYHISYTYDPGGQVLNLAVTRQGNPVADISDVPNISSVVFGTNNTIDIDFGFDGSNVAEPPTYGWEYRNVCLQVIP